MRAPIPFHWDGEAMIPLRPYQRQADKTFVVGQVYPLMIHEQRSSATHNHYFAVLHDAWLNLPEGLSEQFPTEEHLRKYALIKAGFYDSRTLTASSRAEAIRLAAFIKPLDEFSIVTVTGSTVTHYTAKSQSLRAMGKRDFAASKDAVLNILAQMIGVDPAELDNRAGAAA